MAEYKAVKVSKGSNGWADLLLSILLMTRNMLFRLQEAAFTLLLRKLQI